MGVSGPRRGKRLDFSSPEIQMILLEAINGSITYRDAAQRVSRILYHNINPGNLYRHCQRSKVSIMRNLAEYPEPELVDRPVDLGVVDDWECKNPIDTADSANTVSSREVQISSPQHSIGQPCGVFGESHSNSAPISRADALISGQYEILNPIKNLTALVKETMKRTPIENVMPGEMFEADSQMSDVGDTVPVEPPPCPNPEPDEPPPCRNPPKYEFVLSRQSSRMLKVVHGEDIRFYRLANNDKGCELYRCSPCDRLYERKADSAAKIKFMYGNPVSTLTPRHHPKCESVLDAKAEALQIDRETRERMKSGFTTPYAGWSEAHNRCLQLSQLVADHLTPYHSARKSYARLRSSKIPHIPIPLNIPEVYQKTFAAEEEQERFLLLCDESHSLLIFATDTALKEAARSDILVGDATFLTAPQGFYQVLTLHCRVHNDTGYEWISFLHAVMVKKEQEHYLVVMNALAEKWREFGCNPCFRLFRFDFERGLMNAAAEVFGMERIGGCLFHFTNDIVKNARHHNLTRFYNQKKGPIYEYIRRLCSLGLLPKELIMNYYKHSLENPPTEPEIWEKPYPFALWPTKDLRLFAAYFHRQWIRLTPARLWNFYGESEVRTTNVAEAHHSRINKRWTQGRRPSMTNFLNGLRSWESEQATRIRQIKKGKEVRARNKKYVQLDARFRRYFEEFPDTIKQALASDPTGQLIVELCTAYLDKCCYLLAEFAPSGETMKMAAIRTKKRPCDEQQNPAVDLDDVDKAWNDANKDKIYMKATGIMDVKGCNLQTLKESKWLDDVVINGFFHLIEQRSVHNPNTLPKICAIDSLYYPLLSAHGPAAIVDYFLRKKTEQFDYVLFPIFTTAHWSLIYIKPGSKLICYYDSLEHTVVNTKKLFPQMMELMEYVIPTLGGEKWRVETVNGPKQENGDDCGVFASLR